jgi:hypothetical protein
MIMARLSGFRVQGYCGLTGFFVEALAVPPAALARLDEPIPGHDGGQARAAGATVAGRNEPRELGG